MSGFAAVWQIAPKIVSQTLGLPFSHYRPLSTGPAISSANYLGQTPVWITADPTLKTFKTINPEKPVLSCAVDPTVVQVGDYLTGPVAYGGPIETFFVATVDANPAIAVVLCNAVLSLSRPTAPAPGPEYYGGNVRGSQTALVTSWPASVLPGTKGNDGDTKLPSDNRLPWVKILMPNAPGVQFRFADFGQDASAQPNQYELSAAIQTRSWWNLTASQVVA